MPLTVKAVQRVMKATQGIANEYSGGRAYIHVVFPEHGEVHRFSANNGKVTHIESHSPHDIVLLSHDTPTIDGEASPY